MRSRDPNGSLRDEAWRDAWRERLASGDEACPNDEALASLALGELAGDERVALADHVASCRRCAESYRTLIDLRSAGAPSSTTVAHDADEAARRRAVPGSLTLVAAAALVAVVGLVVVRVSFGPGWERDPEASTLRGPIEQRLAPEPEQGAIVTEAPRRLAWRVLEESSSEPTGAPPSWIVEVYDDEMRPLWRSERIDQPEAALPETLRERLDPGSTFYWRVSPGDDGDGQTALFRFRIRR